MASAFFLFSIKTILNLPCHSCYTSQIPGAEAIFNQIGSLCFINSMPQKLQHNETEQERSKMEGNIHNSHHFYCHVYLCVYFKSTWYLAEMLWSCALRDTQWSNTLTDSWLDHRNTASQMRPDVPEFSLLHCNTKIFAPRQDIYSVRHNSVTCKGAWGTVSVPAVPGNLHPFPHFLIIPQQSSLKGDDACRAWAHLLHSLAAE